MSFACVRPDRLYLAWLDLNNSSCTANTICMYIKTRRSQTVNAVIYTHRLTYNDDRCLNGLNGLYYIMARYFFLFFGKRPDNAGAVGLKLKNHSNKGVAEKADFVNRKSVKGIKEELFRKNDSLWWISLPFGPFHLMANPTRAGWESFISGGRILTSDLSPT